MMTLPQTVNRKIRMAFHSIGLSCLGGAIFLQVLVFADILSQGYFKAVEANPTILWFEIGLTGFAAIYFIYLYVKLMRQL